MNPHEKNEDSTCKPTPRSPALVVAILFAYGIVVDRVLSSRFDFWRWELLVFLELFLLISWLILQRLQGQLALTFLCGAVTICGASWHHWFWELIPPKHIRNYASEEATPVLLEATVLSEPIWKENQLPDFASAWPGSDRTIFHIQSEQIHLTDRTLPVSGRIRLTVSGAFSGVQTGDQILVVGKMRNLPPNRNPGTYDFAEDQRRDSILTTLFCEHAEGVQVLKKADIHILSWFHQGLDDVRIRIREVFQQTLPTDSAAMANALILGDRTQLDDEVNTAFRRSGLMHLLSISGLHVALIGALAGWLACLLGGTSRSFNQFTLAGMTLAWILAEFRPPVFRAWLLGLMLFWSWTSFRKIRTVQALGLAGWICLIVNPSWLFDVGTQLSFLAIVAILGCWKWMPSLFRKQEETQLLASESTSDSPTYFQLGLRKVILFLKQTAFISLAITLFLLPILTAHFHLVSLAGIPATVLALPLLAIALPGLILTAVIGFFSTTIASLIANPTHYILMLMSELAELFSHGPLQWLPSGMNSWIVACFCLLTGLLVFLPKQTTMPLKAGISISWCLLLVVGLSPISNSFFTQSLECRVLSVGHGNACLMRCPNGQTILFDAGSMENGRFASSAITASLSDLGCNRLDAIIISHTDTDHLNAIPFLMDEVPIHTIFLNPVGLNPRHPGLSAIVEKAADQQIKLQLLQPEDEIKLDKNVRISTLQCGTSPLPYSASDNEHSIVMEVEYADRHLLFPADVSGNGQKRLFEETSPGYDFFVAPHHGSIKDNAPDFVKWAAAEIIVFSTGDEDHRDYLTELYNPQQVLWTTGGAVRCRIDAQGHFSVEQWQRNQHWGIPLEN
ncbi:ComEC/Rec2 family competence protein [Rubinisphaera italica]|uniref:ComEC family competence protein n=1 Tax=Rubinisphaera italica TaxID=2527969 RepID=A0A5C5XHD4_9PLAN|nr:ComEC/Rec2 family competence protein [Rubinisphaera italica]TWT62497.1 ComEC family competence protein [Rubinisphaera italica]